MNNQDARDTMRHGALHDWSLDTGPELAPPAPPLGATITPGHIAYQAFATALRQHTPGTTTARWAELAPHLRSAWERAAREVVLYASPENAP